MVTPDAKTIATAGTILRGVVGSSCYGLNVPGTDDRDEMGVCVEPLRYVIGLQQFDQWVYRTQPEGVRSGPGDLDLTIYSLRKFARLAAQGNPSILSLLYLPRYEVCTHLGHMLVSRRDVFASRAAGPRFRGYLVSQRQRLLGERGQKRVKRPELEAAHGFDTKYAMHMLRLGFEGVEYLATGTLTLPMPEAERSYCYAVRMGEVPLDEVIAKSVELEQRITALADAGPLPAEPDYDDIDALLLDAYGARPEALVA